MCLKTEFLVCISDTQYSSKIKRYQMFVYNIVSEIRTWIFFKFGYQTRTRCLTFFRRRIPFSSRKRSTKPGLKKNIFNKSKRSESKRSDFGAFKSHSVVKLFGFGTTFDNQTISFGFRTFGWLTLQRSVQISH